MKLKYIGFMEKSGAPDEYTNPDGSFGQWEFQNLLDGNQKFYTNKNAKNALVIGLKQGEVKENDTIELTRTGAGKDTRYTVKKLSQAEATAVKSEMNVDSIPF